MLVEKLQGAGFALVADGDQLKVTGFLNDDQRDFIRQHKAELLAELKAVSLPSPATRLRRLAVRYRIDPDELRHWYREDYADVEAMDDGTLGALIRDYACNRSSFRNEHPYQSYQLWLYRLDKRKEGLIHQSIMTTDPEEALRRLEFIYGVGNVFNLHRKGK